MICLRTLSYYLAIKSNVTALLRISSAMKFSRGRLRQVGNEFQNLKIKEKKYG